MDSLGKTLSKIVPNIRYSFKVYPGPNQSMDDLINKMKELDNPILSIEKDHITSIQYTETNDSWGCLVCLEGGNIVLLDSEQEYRDHLEEFHPEWVEQGDLIVV